MAMCILLPTMQTRNHRLCTFTKLLFALHMDLAKQEVKKKQNVVYGAVVSILLLTGSKKNSLPRRALSGNCQIDFDPFVAKGCWIVLKYWQTSIASPSFAEEI